MDGWLKLLAVAIAVVVGLYLAWDWLLPSASLRYRMTVEVEAGGKLHVGSGVIEVRYEIKLPRELKQIDIKDVNGAIRLTDLNGSITAKTTNGSVDLSDISVNGQLKVGTVNGSAKAVIEELQQKGPIELATTNGSVAVQIKPDVDAQLSANSMQGSISLDDAFGLKVEKGFPFGQHVDGAIGRGGPPITIKTMNGSIKITK